MTGELHCRICDAKFQTTITTLTEPIDVFSEWLDEAEEKMDNQLRSGEAGLDL
jgi:transcription elongation factor Elf1